MNHNDFDLQQIESNKFAYNEFITQALLSFKQMYFFARPPSCASTAIARFLHNQQFSDSFQYNFFSDELKVDNHSMASLAIGALNYPYQISQKLFKKILSGNSPFLNISIVRNPYDRAISSLYFTKKKQPQDIKPIDILKFYYMKQPNIHFIPLTEMINYHHVKYDFIIRYEDLASDMALLFPQYHEKQGVSARDKAFGNDLLQSDEFIALVQHYESDDFDNFGYSRDIKEINEYDNNILPRSLDKWHNPNNYPCDISLLSGEHYFNHAQEYKKNNQHIGDFIANIAHWNIRNIPQIIQQWKDEKKNENLS